MIANFIDSFLWLENDLQFCRVLLLDLQGTRQFVIYLQKTPTIIAPATSQTHEEFYTASQKHKSTLLHTYVL